MHCPSVRLFVYTVCCVYLLQICLYAGMGENNCAWNRQPMIQRETLAAAAAIYKGIINIIN